ncbi:MULTISPECIES: LD-carboxypeptidase [unclassified Pseudomonas]|uniref:S66 peptidase family protein n=1 Tax=unclassified Pseudomonas TaxID=196821 RepID=UPI002AC945F6|nr:MULTISPECIES: LD-carboxypeptidase [unclassified Pseudomonas]MEB0042280.1 LD-carboxypeptidase [Pseudomonas sp. MH10]MEB0122653.1 LD-carboxypeptidase [Pseudomonas sp. CCI1.2]WPX65532.1 LD-carboxypeptidase [Pseudomonas sp. MH10]
MDFHHTRLRTDQPTLHPQRLQVGDAVALVSPAGPVPQARVEAAVKVLTSWGLQPRVYPHALDKYSFYAGSDEQRATDLNDALADPEIRAVICNRGGYGVQRIIEHLDFDAVRRDPKLVLGFSDITALHAALWCNARLATIHGPVGAQLERGGLTNSSVKHTLMTAEPTLIKADPTEATVGVRRQGIVNGLLLGGNLSLLSTSVGTPFMPDLNGAILLIEDVGESAYRVDRLLTHLRNCGILQRVAGIAVGQFSEPLGVSGQVTLVDVLRERLCDLGVPVLGGLSIGHGDPNIAVPLGTYATLDADTGTLWVAPACY